MVLKKCCNSLDILLHLGMEKWKKISGYKYYLISNLGRVKSINDKGNWGDGRILKTIVRKSGYCVVNLWSYSGSDKKMKQHKVHKLVANAFIPNTKNKPIINHIDGDKENNKAANLEWCTHSENMVHSYKNGLHKVDKGNKTTKLNKKQVKEIRQRYKEENISQADLSKDYPVCEGQIRKIINKECWKWV